MEQLEYESFIGGIRNGRELVGSTLIDGKSTVLLYDIPDDKLTLLSIPENGKVLKSNDFTEQDITTFIVITDADLVQYQLVGNTLQEKERLSLNGKLLSGMDLLFKVILFYDQDIIWVKDINGNFIRRINLAKKSYVDYPFTRRTKRKLAKVDGRLQVSVFEFGSDAYVSWVDVTTAEEQMFQVDLDTERQLSLDWIPPSYGLFRRVHRDSVGNLVFVFEEVEKNKRSYKAILKDIGGRLYDYTSFVASLKGLNIYMIQSLDFRQQVMVCNARGFLLHKVKSNEAIKALPPYNSVRAMVDYGPDKLLINIQGPEKYLLNTKS
ncbi:MAG: hypothetical protein AAFQ37_01655, partial [Bacteroidota bacterium]